MVQDMTVGHKDMMGAITQCDEMGSSNHLFGAAILDTPTEHAFDQISSLAARLFDAPISLISIIDGERIQIGTWC